MPHQKADTAAGRTVIASLLEELEASPTAQATTQRAAKADALFASVHMLPSKAMAVDGRRLLSRPQYRRAVEAVQIGREVDALLIALYERAALLPAEGLEIAPAKAAGAMRGTLGHLVGELNRMLDRHEYAEWRLKGGLPMPTLGAR